MLLTKIGVTATWL